MATAITTRSKLRSKEKSIHAPACVDLKQLKEVMHHEVLDAMDHRFLNREVPEFLTRIPTTETWRSPSGYAWKRNSRQLVYTAFGFTRLQTCSSISMEEKNMLSSDY